MDYMFYAQAVEETAQQVLSSPDLFWTIIASAFGGAVITSGVTVWSKIADSKSDKRKREEDRSLEQAKRAEDFKAEQTRRREDFRFEREKRVEDLEAERQKWVREEKLAVYAKYITMARSCVNDSGVGSQLIRAKTTRTEMVAETSLLTLLAGQQIGELAKDLTIALKKYIAAYNLTDGAREEAYNSAYTLLNRLSSAMQSDLGLIHSNTVEDVSPDM